MGVMKRWFPLPLLVVAALPLAGCGPEDLIERAVERETGEDVDLDISNGEFSIRTNDGEINMSTDEDGNVQIIGNADGEEFNVNASADGNVTGDTPHGTFNVTADDSTLNADTDDGSMQLGSQIPDDFPASIPLPDDLVVESGVTYTEGQSTTWQIVGTTSGEDQVVNDLRAALRDAGYTETQTFEQAGTYQQATYDGEYTVNLVAAIADGTVSLTILVSDPST